MMTFDEVHTRFIPFLTKRGFTFERQLGGGMGRLVDYVSDAFAMRILLDRFYFEIELSPPSTAKRQWITSRVVRAQVLGSPRLGFEHTESPESSVDEVLVDLRFLEEHFEEVRSLFSVHNFVFFARELNARIFHELGIPVESASPKAENKRVPRSQARCGMEGLFHLLRSCLVKLWR